MSNLEDKLEHLITKYPASKKELENKLKTLKIADVVLSLKDHEGMKILLKGIKDNIEGINTILTTNRDMTQEDRIAAFAQRDVFEWLLNHFTGAENAKNSIKKYIEKYGK